MPQPAAVRQGRSRRRQSLLRPRLSPQPPPAPLPGLHPGRAAERRAPGTSAIDERRRGSLRHEPARPTGGVPGAGPLSSRVRSNATLLHSDRSAIASVGHPPRTPMSARAPTLRATAGRRLLDGDCWTADATSPEMLNAAWSANRSWHWMETRPAGVRPSFADVTAESVFQAGPGRLTTRIRSQHPPAIRRVLRRKRHVATT